MIYKSVHVKIIKYFSCIDYNQIILLVVVVESRQARYQSRQKGIGSKKVDDLGSQIFRNLVEGSRHKEKTSYFRFLSFGDSVIKSGEVTQKVEF